MEEREFCKLDKKFEKKNMIADAAFEVFMEKGYMATRIIDIAKKAGMGKGTFYEYFESKESVLLFLIDNRIMTEYKAQLDEVNRAETVKEKLRAYIDAERSIMEKYGNHMQDMRNRRPEECMEFSELIGWKIMEFATMEYKVVHQIAELGVKTGEFKPLNPNMLAMLIKGGVKTFLVCSTGFPLPYEAPAGLEEALRPENYTEEEFLEILLHGMAC